MISLDKFPEIVVTILLLLNFAFALLILMFGINMSLRLQLATLSVGWCRAVSVTPRSDHMSIVNVCGGISYNYRGHHVDLFAGLF